jgi:hypothetical protein
MGRRPLVRDVLPGLADELERSLGELGRPELARQVGSLRLWAVCPCEVEGCGSFFTALPMKRWFRRGRDVAVGEIVVNTIDGDIVFVEVLGRPELHRTLVSLAL